MLVKFEKKYSYAYEGFRIQEYYLGQEIDLPEDVAQTAIDDGAAAPLKLSKSTEKPKNKAAAAPENKQQAAVVESTPEPAQSAPNTENSADNSEGNGDAA